MKVLVADDDRLIRSIQALTLRKLGYEVVEAADGAEAWQTLVAGDISLVISDWVMPRLTGPELCRRIRSGDLARYVYVILCTSKGQKSDLIEGMEAGADDFLVKPVVPEELRVRVRAGERVLDLERRLADRHKQLEDAWHRIEKDLKAAAFMQQSLLPQGHPTIQGVESRWLFRPSSFVAGDIFNFFALDEKTVGFYLLDVSGHGIPSAMLSVSLSKALSPDPIQGSPLKRLGADAHSYEIVRPHHVVAEVNNRFQSADDMYFTMIYGTLDTPTRRLALTQAGHPSPFLLHRAAGRIEALGSGGMPVGMLPGVEYELTETTLAPGDRLILYSDGVTECENPQGEQFGEERMVAVLERERPLEASLEALHRELSGWRRQADFYDDVSILALEMGA